MIPRDRISFFLFLLVFLMGILVLLLVAGAYFKSSNIGFGQGGLSSLNTGSYIVDNLGASVARFIPQSNVVEQPDRGEVRGVRDPSEVTASDLGFIEYPVVQIEDNASLVADQS